MRRALLAPRFLQARFRVARHYTHPIPSFASGEPIEAWLPVFLKKVAK
jgi:hypothetical protein